MHKKVWWFISSEYQYVRPNALQILDRTYTNNSLEEVKPNIWKKLVKTKVPLSCFLISRHLSRELYFTEIVKGYIDRIYEILS